MGTLVVRENGIFSNVFVKCQQSDKKRNTFNKIIQELHSKWWTPRWKTSLFGVCLEETGRRPVLEWKWLQIQLSLFLDEPTTGLDARPSNAAFFLLEKAGKECHLLLWPASLLHLCTIWLAGFGKGDVLWPCMGTFVLVCICWLHVWVLEQPCWFLPTCDYWGLLCCDYTETEYVGSWRQLKSFSVRINNTERDELMFMLIPLSTEKLNLNWMDSQ